MGKLSIISCASCLPARVWPHTYTYSVSGLAGPFRKLVNHEGLFVPTSWPGAAQRCILSGFIA